jgi:hypothetical protein
VYELSTPCKGEAAPTRRYCPRLSTHFVKRLIFFKRCLFRSCDAMSSVLSRLGESAFFARREEAVLVTFVISSPEVGVGVRREEGKGLRPPDLVFLSVASWLPSSDTRLPPPPLPPSLPLRLPNEIALPFPLCSVGRRFRFDLRFLLDNR